ncbi:hypothetical protein CEP53_013102 [Fusarium sp. AF-6]|nr:hypothetical protein CEP53_013102 [Fusarium sp. AF-6]
MQTRNSQAQDATPSVSSLKLGDNLTDNLNCFTCNDSSYITAPTQLEPVINNTYTRRMSAHKAISPFPDNNSAHYFQQYLESPSSSHPMNAGKSLSRSAGQSWHD